MCPFSPNKELTVTWQNPDESDDLGIEVVGLAS